MAETNNNSAHTQFTLINRDENSLLGYSGN